MNAGASDFDIHGINSTHSDEITWHGQFRYKRGQSKDSPYIRERDELANASYSGGWEEVIALLEIRKVDCGENWANCWRIKETSGSPSGFTTLHQVAWYGAPQRVVQELLRLGAWKLARTLRPSKSSRTRSTPYDIARDHGHTHLYDLLCPIVRRPTDPRALQALQHNLHALIKEQFPRDLLEGFFLPDLEVLTEFEHSDLWFPLNPESPDTRGRLGVHIILKHDELVVVMHKGAERKNYHISTYMVREIPEAVMRH
ncbi:hypothetical protein BCR34DRAFT_572486 [Clohesyomyces aquaticus]|uniref:Ankyrin repeat-containing domain protein n=1 Tax=Clohesyomyces aquaticus TaxID=1231657 RepID=A0A1Y1Z3J1_9PLEO|nr:hypothetical protein BCR34DRAFT_572486 [Clohesyomyces aquaticus]